MDFLTENNHDHAVPIIGGPLCGQSITMQGHKLPKKIPMFYEGCFHEYQLIVVEQEYCWSVYYEFQRNLGKPEKRISYA